MANEVRPIVQVLNESAGRECGIFLKTPGPRNVGHATMKDADLNPSISDAKPQDLTSLTASQGRPPGTNPPPLPNNSVTDMCCGGGMKEEEGE